MHTCSKIVIQQLNLKTKFIILQSAQKEEFTECYKSHWITVKTSLPLEPEDQKQAQLLCQVQLCQILPYNWVKKRKRDFGLLNN